MKCPHCSFDNAATARFCENCGRPLEHNCPNCGHQVSASARFCPNCGYSLTDSQPNPGLTAALPNLPQPDPQGEQMQGERKLVTAVFADIVDSTGLAESMDPEDWREIVSGAHRRVSEAVYRFQGTVAQLLGDGVLAFFGAPLAHEDDAERAVRAALAIQTAVQGYAADLRASGRVPAFAMRIGLNTGLVVVGNIGTGRHMEYLAVGDTVNLAARMQGAAEPGTILVSENTYRHIMGLFEVVDLGKIAVKGKGEAVQVYRVEAERRGGIRMRGVPGLSSPMVGRQREFASLMQIVTELKRGGEEGKRRTSGHPDTQTYRETGTRGPIGAPEDRGGHGAIVAIVGEAGLGKSRLVAEWRKAARMAERPGEPPLHWIEGRCLSFGANEPYHLVVDLLRSLIGAPTSAGPDELEGALRGAISGLSPVEPALPETYPYLAHLLGVELDAESAQRVRFLSGPTVHEVYARALRTHLGALARTGPVVIVAEDIHWADPSSVEVLLQVLPLAQQARIVLTFVTRPDRDATGWRLLTGARDVPGVSSIELHLSPLAESDSQQLVSYLLDVAALPPVVRHLVLSRAEGNPYYVEEVIRMLIDRGGLRRQENAWVVTGDLKDIDIPDTLQGVIMARIDRLPAEVKHTLQVAAVIGRRFQVDLLEAVLKGTP